MTVIAVPYHLDEHLPDLDLPFTPAEVVGHAAARHVAAPLSTVLE